jgi:hypothetical protein
VWWHLCRQHFGRYKCSLGDGQGYLLDDEGNRLAGRESKPGLAREEVAMSDVDPDEHYGDEH